MCASIIFATSPKGRKLLLKVNFVILMLMTKSPKGGVLVTSNSAVSCEFQLIPHPSLYTTYASAGIASLSDVTLVQKLTLHCYKKSRLSDRIQFENDACSGKFCRRLGVRTRLEEEFHCSREKF
jgi:hypothetical protein